MLDGPELLERFRQQDRRALSRLISRLEEEDPRAETWLEELAAGAGRAYVVGITGPPGVGKSSLVGTLAANCRRDGREVGIIAVDPSSALSGGAFLGDRVRLAAVAGDPRVYMRSLAARGERGGLSVAAWSAVLALEAFGFDIILLETVGSGQGDTDVAELADSVVLVGAPALGDTIQFLKAGIMELADIFVVNMADRAGGAETAAKMRAALTLRREAAWSPPVLLTIAPSGEGVPELWAALREHDRYLGESGQGEVRRRRRFTGHVCRLVWRAVLLQTEEQLRQLDEHQGKQAPFSTARSVLAALGEGSVKKGDGGPGR